eukprot:2033954-Alexandrium_andersonii.AAC.1
MQAIDAARSLYNDPGQKFAAIAKIIMMFAKRLHADDSQMERLAGFVTDISDAQPSTGASASADGG